MRKQDYPDGPWYPILPFEIQHGVELFCPGEYEFVGIRHEV